jgi:hypothetical protein
MSALDFARPVDSIEFSEEIQCQEYAPNLSNELRDPLSLATVVCELGLRYGNQKQTR